MILHITRKEFNKLVPQIQELTIDCFEEYEGYYIDELVIRAGKECAIFSVIWDLKQGLITIPRLDDSAKYSIKKGNLIKKRGVLDIIKYDPCITLNIEKFKKRLEIFDLFQEVT